MKEICLDILAAITVVQDRGVVTIMKEICLEILAAITVVQNKELLQ